MWIKFFARQYREGDPDGEGSGQSPAEINAAGNRARIDRLNRIANQADGNRSTELSDVEGERVTGRFQAGELDDSPEARERAAEEEEARAQQALADQREDAERLEGEEARRLQSEGAADEHEEGRESPEGAGARPDQEGDERVINGVKHYAVPINGQLQWLTLKQLRDDRSKAGDVDRALQDAQAALQSATDLSLRPNPAEQENDLDEADLENVLNSAVMGDSEAIKRLVPLLKRTNPGLTQAEIAQTVSRQLATQRLIDQGETGQKDLLEHPILGGVFRQRFNQLKSEAPNTKIDDAYKKVGDTIRKDFAPMLTPGGGARGNGANPPPADKAARKRTLVTPPSAANRQQAAADPDREVPVGETIDQIARSRGQSRAIRSSRR